MANKNEAGEQNAIDKLNDNLGQASERIAANKKVIFWAVGGVAVVAAFVLSYLFIYRNPHINRSFEAFNAVEITAAGNDSVATAEYMKVSKEYGSSDAGQLAALSAAENLYTEGKYKEAVALLEKVNVSEPILGANALVLRGDCYVNLKDYDKALDTFKKAISKADKNPQIVPRILLKEANVYDAKKNYAEAMKCYETIKTDYPQFAPGNGLSIDAYIAREAERLAK